MSDSTDTPPFSMKESLGISGLPGVFVMGRARAFASPCILAKHDAVLHLLLNPEELAELLFCEDFAEIVDVLQAHLLHFLLTLDVHLLLFGTGGILFRDAIFMPYLSDFGIILFVERHELRLLLVRKFQAAAHLRAFSLEQLLVHLFAVALVAWLLRLGYGCGRDGEEECEKELNGVSHDGKFCLEMMCQDC